MAVKETKELVTQHQVMVTGFNYDLNGHSEAKVGGLAVGDRIVACCGSVVKCIADIQTVVKKMKERAEFAGIDSSPVIVDFLLMRVHRPFDYLPNHLLEDEHFTRARNEYNPALAPIREDKEYPVRTLGLVLEMVFKCMQQPLKYTSEAGEVWVQSFKEELDKIRSKKRRAAHSGSGGSGDEAPTPNLLKLMRDCLLGMEEALRVTGRGFNYARDLAEFWYPAPPPPQRQVYKDRLRFHWRRTCSEAKTYSQLCICASILDRTIHLMIGENLEIHKDRSYVKAPY
jgi:hypothetical protein